MKYGLSEKQLAEIVERIGAYSEVETAVLFGSRAIDTFKEASDVDIALKGKHVTASLAAKLKYEFEEESYLPFFFDFVAFPTITNEALRRHIDDKGIVIFRRGMSEWQETKLGNTGKIITGKTPSKDNPEDWGNEVLFITPSDYKNYGKKAYSSIRMLSKTGAKRQQNRMLPPNSILVTCIGSDMGKSVVNAVPCVFNQQINAIIPDSSVANGDYLYYLTLDFYETLKSLGSDGTAVPILNKSDFENIDISLPALPEQEAIATVLSSLDDKIDLLHRQNKTLEAMAETLFRQWFVVEAWEDWEEGTLADVSLNIRDSVKVDGIQENCNYIGLEHIDRKNIALKECGLGGDVNSNKYAFSEKDILFGKLRPYFHKVCFAPFSGICSTDILVIRPIKKEWFCFCLFAFFQNDVVEFANLGSGGTRMPRTDWGTLKTYPIAIPDIESINRFNNFVLPSIDKIKTNLQQIRTLESLRDTLLPKLMSGEVRVNLQELST